MILCILLQIMIALTIKKIKSNAKLIIDTRNVFKKEIQNKIIKL